MEGGPWLLLMARRRDDRLGGCCVGIVSWGACDKAFVHATDVLSDALPTALLVDRPMEGTLMVSVVDVAVVVVGKDV